MTSIPRIGPITSSFMSRSKTGKHPFAQASLHDVVAVVAAPPPRHGCAIATTDRPGGGPPTPRRSRSLFLGPARRERGKPPTSSGGPDLRSPVLEDNPGAVPGRSTVLPPNSHLHRFPPACTICCQFLNA